MRTSGNPQTLGLLLGPLQTSSKTISQRASPANFCKRSGRRRYKGTKKRVSAMPTHGCRYSVANKPLGARYKLAVTGVDTNHIADVDIQRHLHFESVLGLGGLQHFAAGVPAYRRFRIHNFELYINW